MSVLVCLRFTVSCQWNWGEIETERRKTLNLKSVKPLRAKNEIFPPFDFFIKNTHSFWIFEALNETERYIDFSPQFHFVKKIRTVWLFLLYGEMVHCSILISFWGKYKSFQTNLLLKLLNNPFFSMWPTRSVFKDRERWVQLEPEVMLMMARAIKINADDGKGNQNHENPGNDTIPGAYPWAVGIQFLDKLYCGGSLISRWNYSSYNFIHITLCTIFCILCFVRMLE